MSDESPLLIREAMFEETRQMALLRMLSVHQRVGKKPAKDFYVDPTDIANQLENYTYEYMIPGFHFYVAEAEEFSADFPIIGAHGKPLTGLMITCPGEYSLSQIRIGHLYTVPSPYKTGAELLKHSVEMAGQRDCDSLRTTAVYDASKTFFKNRGHFVQKNNPSDLWLYNRDFVSTLSSLDVYLNEPSRDVSLHQLIFHQAIK
jgi:hypothetical protein